MSSFAVIALSLAGATLLLIGGWAALRRRAYDRELKYDPRQDCVLALEPGTMETVSVTCDLTGFVLPALPANAVSVFLELKVRAAIAGSLFDPRVEIHCRQFHDQQAFERNARGIRFLNLTRLIHAGAKAGDHVALRGFHLTWAPGQTRVHVCSESVCPEDRVLVIAPHPDDAEIGAFGLYSDTNATVVTISAGDGSDRYNGGRDALSALPRSSIARMRVLDSLMAPQIGGLSRENALNLCYPDGKLAEMRLQRTSDFCGEGAAALDFDGLRKLNASAHIRNSASCSWDSLIADFSRILFELRPTVIVAPHPWLDPHSDHMLSTLAVNEALSATDLKEGRFYFYANHNRHSELWPFGPAGSGVGPLPLLANDVVGCDGFYSHPLSPQRQQEKFIALEANHDVRDVTSTEPRSVYLRWRRIRSEAMAALHGMGLPPTSYLRRAVRPDEFFFVASFARARELCERALTRG